ncbi:MAG: RsbRD N-terminal domain-containing protein, partial [Armatimonadetes bacterium]|nr:RsbRD N-terminal domain-containing protein [Armatimonadota bacterium]
MTNSHGLLSSEEAANHLKRQSALIFQRWEAAVRSQIPAAQNQTRPVLYNSLPKFIDQLIEALSQGRELDDSAAAEFAREHGEQRAHLSRYSLDQFIQEFNLLRRAICDELESASPLDPRAGALLHAGIDRAIQKATSRYVNAANALLRESEERFRLLLEGAQDYSILELDSQGHVILWSEAA